MERTGAVLCITGLKQKIYVIECLSYVILNYVILSCVILNYVILSEAKDLITNVKDGSTDIIQVYDRWFIDLPGTGKFADHNMHAS